MPQLAAAPDDAAPARLADFPHLPVVLARKPARSRLLAAAFATLAGLVAHFALALAFAVPASAPLMAPIVVVIGASALWGAARADHLRLRADLDRLAA